MSTSTSSSARGPFVLTREPADNIALAQRLREAGAEVLEWQALATALVLPAEQAAAAREQLRNADWVAFTSRRGVEAAAHLFGGEDALGAALRAARLAAVGPATTHSIEECGLSVEHRGSGTGAAALASHLVRVATPGASVVLVRSAAADDLAFAALHDRGLEVTDLRLHAPIEPPPRKDAPRPLAAVACASPSAARRLLGWNPWLVGVPFAAIGATTAHSLRDELLVTRVEIARSPDDDGLLAALLAAARLQ